MRLSNPAKPYFPAAGHTKLELAEYYLACADAALLDVRERPTVLKRYVNGDRRRAVLPEARAREARPSGCRRRPSRSRAARSATELSPDDAAHSSGRVNLGMIDFNPWPVRRADVDHPDELRVDLDPQPEVELGDVRQVALCVREVLDDHGLVGFPKTSGSRGIHINVRIEPELGLHRGPPRRARPGARGRAPRCPGRAT